MTNFYEVRNVPAHSVLLMSSREKALAYPSGDVRLAWCRNCGFISNLGFDPGLHEYSERYEEVQTFSPTFKSFTTGIIERLVERRRIRDKDIVEIGCGKGDFLLELCEKGCNRGIGIDPSSTPERAPHRAVDRVRFIQEFYSPERHRNLPLDLLVCRHTLEHIYPTCEFMAAVHRSLENRDDVLVFFEVPDASRILNERAFWDIYYEHCSYFTKRSLTHLFLSSGFEILDLWQGFGDQYLLLEARPLGHGNRASFPVGESLEDLCMEIEGFASDVHRDIERWRRCIQQFAETGKRLAIWGAGSKAVAFLTTLGIGSEITCAVDINPHKHGYFLPGSGHEVVPPAHLKELQPHAVVVMNSIYCEEIGASLKLMGLTPAMTTV